MQVEYIAEFLSVDEADALGTFLRPQTWAPHYDYVMRISYGARMRPQQTNTHPTPVNIQALTDKLVARYSATFNSVECYLHQNSSHVKPHVDMFGDVVCMIRLGSPRVFVAGGQNIRLAHGSLLTFRGPVMHAMSPDPEAGQCISLLFRQIVDLDEIEKENIRLAQEGLGRRTRW